MILYDYETTEGVSMNNYILSFKTYGLLNPFQLHSSVFNYSKLIADLITNVLSLKSIRQSWSASSTISSIKQNLKSLLL